MVGICKHRICDHTDCGDRCPSKKQPRGDPHRHSLPPYVCEATGPVSEILTTETLQSKCAHGGTQNNNARERCSGEGKGGPVRACYLDEEAEKTLKGQRQGETGTLRIAGETAASHR